MKLGFTEQVMFRLRALYRAYGYAQYRMSKFEEYDLYARNKDFLISDSVITFTDTNGKLMALKPDVTLSIIKNTKEQAAGVQKVYYSENVYRAAKDTGFREMMQVGLECFGAIDEYQIAEVIALAAKSLHSIADDCVLDISHLGLAAGLIDACGVSKRVAADMVRCIGEKNAHELAAICRAAEVPETAAAALAKLITTAGAPDRVLTELGTLMPCESLDQLRRVVDALDDDTRAMLRIDFSVVDDINYYNGIVFKGFINGVPAAVLSGGQYDKLMQKMHRKDSAIGFAVYTDMLERLDGTEKGYDVDTVLLYDDGADPAVVRRAVDGLIAAGAEVLAARQVPQALRYRRLARIVDGEVAILENNA